MLSHINAILACVCDQPMNQLGEIEKLDLAARAEAIGNAISRAVLPIAFVTVIIVVLAFTSEASFYETLAVRTLAVLAIVTTIMLRRSSRYSAFALAAFFFAALAGAWLFDAPDYHSLLGSTTRIMISTMFVFVGFRWWSNAMLWLNAASGEFEKESSQLKQWLSVVQSPETEDDLFEFSIRSFVRGHWTYRLLNTGSCWVVAQFRNGRMTRLSSCRVLRLSAVRLVKENSGKLGIEIGDRLVQDIRISPDMRDRLERFAASAEVEPA